jgi:hypothetical protein
MPKRYPSCFLSCSFDEKDQSLFDLFHDILTALEFEVNTAKRPEAKPPAEKIRNLIQKSDTMVVVITRRHPIEGKDEWIGPQWVQSEIGMAYESQKPIAIFIESGIKSEGIVPEIADYIKFDRNELISSIPNILRYLVSLRSLIIKNPLLQEDLTLYRALANELTDFASLVSMADQNLDMSRWGLSLVYAKTTGRFYTLPPELQTKIDEAYQEIYAFQNLVNEVSKDSYPSFKVFGKENEKDKLKRMTKLEIGREKIKQEKGMVLQAIFEPMMDLWVMGYPEMVENIRKMVLENKLFNINGIIDKE